MIPLIILAASLVTHLLFFGHPNQVVFDEVHFGYFVSHYLQGSYYFDIHPPFGKIFMAAIAYIFSVPAVVNWSMIGNDLPEAWVMMRLVPTFFGVLLPVVIFGILRRLGLSMFASAIAASLLILENSLLVHSRFILFDSMLLFFGFLSIFLFLEFRNEQRNYKPTMRSFVLVLAIISGVAAFSIKWTGLAYPLLIVLLDYFMLAARGTPRKIIFKKVFKLIVFMAIVSAILYFLVFALHLALLPDSGMGNDFMSPEFQKTLAGNKFSQDESVRPLGLLGRVVELNYKIYYYTATLETPHSYASMWYTWPFMIRPIFFWENAGQYIYYLGNPFIYLTGLAAIVSLFFYAVHTCIRWLRRRDIRHSVPALFIVFGFGVNFIPFVFIERPMFLYHYAAALVFSMMAIAYWVEQIKDQRTKILAGTAVIVISLALFLFFSPITYGLSLSDAELYTKMWFPSWR